MHANTPVLPHTELIAAPVPAVSLDMDVELVCTMTADGIDNVYVDLALTRARTKKPGDLNMLTRKQYALIAKENAISHAHDKVRR